MYEIVITVCRTLRQEGAVSVLIYLPQWLFYNCVVDISLIYVHKNLLISPFHTLPISFSLPLLPSSPWMQANRSTYSYQTCSNTRMNTRGYTTGRLPPPPPLHTHYAHTVSSLFPPSPVSLSTPVSFESPLPPPSALCSHRYTIHKYPHTYTHACTHVRAHVQLKWRASTWVIRAGLFLATGSSWGWNQWACRVEEVNNNFMYTNT